MKTLITVITLFLSFNSFSGILDAEYYVGNEATFKEAVLKNKISIGEWINEVKDENIEFLCLGESHKDNFRTYISENVASKLVITNLFLEADPVDGVNLLEKIDAGQERVEHLFYSDIAQFVRSARVLNPGVNIFGVDQSEEEEIAARRLNNEMGRKVADRDSFIAQNIMNNFSKGELNVALYGSNHCSNNNIGLGGTSFWRILEPVFKKESIKAKTVLFVESGDYGQFDLHMMILGLKAPFVVPDTKAIPPKAFEYNWKLLEFFSNYDVIVYF